MTRPHPILLPVSALFIGASLLAALLLNLLPWGRFVGSPDLVALVLIFWGVHQPRKVGIGAAFGMGLLMDIHDATLLGETALAYTLLSYCAIMMHRRVLWFSVWSQALHVLPLLFMTQLLQLMIHFVVSGRLPHWTYFLASLVAVALWPLATLILLAPQRRAVDYDYTRPI